MMNKLTHLTHYLTHYLTGKTRINACTGHTLHTNARTCVCNYKNITITIHSTYVRTREYVRQVRQVCPVQALMRGCGLTHYARTLSTPSIILF